MTDEEYIEDLQELNAEMAVLVGKLTLENQRLKEILTEYQKADRLQSQPYPFGPRP